MTDGFWQLYEMTELRVEMLFYQKKKKQKGFIKDIVKNWAEKIKCLIVFKSFQDAVY